MSDTTSRDKNETLRDRPELIEELRDAQYIGPDLARTFVRDLMSQADAWEADRIDVCVVTDNPRIEFAHDTTSLTIPFERANELIDFTDVLYQELTTYQDGSFLKRHTRQEAQLYNDVIPDESPFDAAKIAAEPFEDEEGYKVSLQLDEHKLGREFIDQDNSVQSVSPSSGHIAFTDQTDDEAKMEALASELVRAHQTLSDVRDALKALKQSDDIDHAQIDELLDSLDETLMEPDEPSSPDGDTMVG